MRPLRPIPASTLALDAHPDVPWDHLPGTDRVRGRADRGNDVQADREETSGDSPATPLYARLWRVPQHHYPAQHTIQEALDLLIPEVMALDGFAGVTVLVDQTRGDLYATTYWHSQEAMRASQSREIALAQAAVVMTGGEASEARVCDVLLVDAPATMRNHDLGRPE